MWMRWGKFAQAKASFVTAPHIARDWCHPIAMQKPSFKECPHFTEFAVMHPDFVWHFNPVNTSWYTDGSCKGNGRVGARGAWGLVCREGPSFGKSWGGALPKIEPIMSEGVMFDAKPTNIRGEGRALVNAFQQIINAGLEGTHKIGTDSELWIKMMEEYMPNWIAKGTPETFETKKNSDLCRQIYTLSKQAIKLGAVVRYVKARHDYVPDDTTREDWTGNKLAEQAAEANLTL